MVCHRLKDNLVFVKFTVDFFTDALLHAECLVNITFFIFVQKSVTRKKYATRDEDLFSDSTDIFADIPSSRSSQLPASAAKTTDRHTQPPNDDNDGDYESCC